MMNITTTSLQMISKYNFILIRILNQILIIFTILKMIK